MENHSVYQEYTIEQWARFRQSEPLRLTPDELEHLRGLNDRVSMEEVEKIYLPLSRLLSLYVASMQQLNRGVQHFMGTDQASVPFIIGVAGSVAVGKSTVARVLKSLLRRWPEHPKVDLVSTDGFLLSTQELESRNLMHRKGFPESFDRAALLHFLHDVKSGKGNLSAPVYSHLRYDIVPDEFILVDAPDILIVEGLNVLQTASPRAGETNTFISDYFDFSIYIDAEAESIKQWYIDRFLSLRTTVFNQPDAYFSHYAGLDEQQAIATASDIWDSINQVNLEKNILPTRDRARAIVHKSADHAIDGVQLRKL